MINHTLALANQSPTCPVSSAIVMASVKMADDMVRALTLFEDHQEESHGVEAEKPTASDVVVDKKDNVISIDLSKGRKN